MGKSVSVLMAFPTSVLPGHLHNYTAQTLTSLLHDSQGRSRSTRYLTPNMP